MKTFTLVIIISILIGVGIFFGDRLLHSKTNTDHQIVQDIPQSTEKMLPSPSPLPAAPAIDRNSNLEEEINKLTVPDYSEDFKNIKP